MKPRSVRATYVRQRAMSDRNDEARPYKDVRLPKLDVLRLTGQVCRAEYDKETILIPL